METRELVAGSFLADAPIVPVSARTGDGLDAFRAGARGRSRAARRAAAATGGVRLPIDRVFSVKGFGTVVTGTLLSGRMRVDDELALLPGERRAKVRGCRCTARRRPRRTAGQRVAVNLGGVELEEIRRGDTLVTPGHARADRA